jgi:hypothetical protein
MDVVADFTAGPPSLPGSSSVSLNSAGTTTQAWTDGRGRQYELGTAEAGTMTVALNDPHENANPINTASPWNSGSALLLPYRCIQRAGWWNPATLSTAGNLLNSTNTPPGGTTAFDPSFETTVAWTSSFGTSATRTQSAVQAFTGTKSCAVVLTASGDRAGALVWTAPNVRYTLSVYVFVPATYTVTLEFGQYSPTVTTYATATSSTTGAWQRLTVTATATNAVSYWRIKSATAPGFPFTTYVDACQVELASVVSAFATTGPTRYVRHTGYIERYPQVWVDQGFRGMKPLEAVDALSVLSRTVIRQSYQATVLADAPTLYAPLNESAFPQVVQRPLGGQLFQGYTQLGGTLGSVNFSGDRFPDGAGAVVVTQQNTDPDISGDTSFVTYLGTRFGSASVSPQGCTFELWLKFVNGVVYLGAAPMDPGETTGGASTGTLRGLHVYTSGGRTFFHYADPNTSTSPLRSWPGWTGWPDGVWHHLAIILPGGSTTQGWGDGVLGSTAAMGFTPSASIAIENIYAEATTVFGDHSSQLAVANMAVYPTALNSTQLAAHYQRGIGYLGEKSGARVARLLAAYWSSTLYTAAGGYVPMAADYSYDTRSMLDVLQEISATENGFVYANGAGKVVFEDRTTRYASQTSIATFGIAPGQLHYENLEFDYDPTYVYSQANLSRPGNSSYPVKTNTTSLARYGQRIIQATLQVNSDFELDQAAVFYLSRYAAPGGAVGTSAGMRVRKMTLNPAADPALWTFVMGLELSQRVTVSFTTSTGLAMSAPYYVEKFDEAGDPREGTYLVDIQLSPVFVSQAWVLGDSTYGVLGTTTIPVY